MAGQALPPVADGFTMSCTNGNTVELPRKVMEMLEQLRHIGLYGETVDEVALHLIREGITKGVAMRLLYANEPKGTS